MPTILLVDDDISHRTMLSANLINLGFATKELSDGDEILPFLKDNSVDLILLDLKMARMDGLDALSVIVDAGQTVPVIVLTAFSSVETAVLAMKKGAFDYITKPVDIDELFLLIERSLKYMLLIDENRTLKQKLHEQFSHNNIIGSSNAMQKMFGTLSMVSPTDATVLITGESGTGKELVANALHQNSLRKDLPFIKLNCASLHENLLESELFGHERGAFTGATEQRKGRFELADKGTLFLDEIGDMSLPTQAKILRVMQEGEFERVGGTKTVKTDVRILAATHKNLEEMIENETFRQDLFFRLSVVPVHLPPLRERESDIVELANFFLTRFTKKNRKDIKGFHPEAAALLEKYNWPGNIRELENTVERAVILCLGEYISSQELPPQLQAIKGEENALDFSNQNMTLKEMERKLIMSTLVKSDNNKSSTAKKLGIARQTLLNKIRDYSL
ncbi:MAG: sigma-54 dependent transcriptional regulator [Desulfotalea sp.]